MKRLIISESEKQRILGMHQMAANKITLLEQSEDTKLTEIVNANNDYAWQFINGITAAEKAGIGGTVDEDAIVKIVEGIDTIDKYIAILWNIRNNVEGNYCSVFGFTVKRMLQDQSYIGQFDKSYRDKIENKLIASCDGAVKYYGQRKQSVVNNRSVMDIGFFNNVVANQPGGCSSLEKTGKGKGCKGDFGTKKRS